ncbi:ABC transporter substrate-binding protein [Cryptosporangium aurantiacum]|uniref:Peptide/nickel transport system substrate-binding protein n=1 Tax=Cryptosporangium aurantiacum TaxID=134849 RepID=A0A1M7KAR4_9ACTN|nr:ABC transporter substrate-binding protein [Cryptosporangium aurantiacum]SHM62073.1 peptide/nickel transport system substrate-binding protein [Cryptosporangium aurantiacum]
MRKTGLLALLVAGLVALTSCSSEDGDASAGAADTNATVTVRLKLEPTSLDLTTVAGAALDQVLLDNVYQGLLTRDASDKIVPSLASEYEAAPDGLSYTFTLNPKATFHDGSPVTAADVVWSYEQVLSPKSANPNKIDFAQVASVTAPDEKTVKIALKQRDSNFTYALTNRAGVVYKKGATGLADSENGTGPFTLDKWQRGASLTFLRHDEYWGEEAKVAKVVFRYIPDDNAANNATLAGDIDVLTALDPKLLAPYENNQDFAVQEGIASDKIVLGFNNAYGPLKDVRVRRAIRQAIDKDGLISSYGEGIRIGGPVASTDPWYDESLTSIDKYDPAAAKKLLAEAGVSNLKLTLTVANFYPPLYAEYVTSQLKQVGITVEIKSVPFATWLDTVFTEANYQLSIVDHAEARDIGIWANPKYYFRYDSKAVQKLVADAQVAPSEDQRDELLAQAAKQVSEDAAGDFLSGGQIHTVVRKGVEGFPKDSTSSRLNLASVTAS